MEFIKIDVSDIIFGRVNERESYDRFGHTTNAPSLILSYIANSGVSRIT